MNHFRHEPAVSGPSLTLVECLTNPKPKDLDTKSDLHPNALCLLSGEGNSTPRSSKRSLLPDLIGEGEQADTNPAEPSSPPKKSRLNKDGRSQDPMMPLQSSGSVLPDQAAATQDMGHVTMSRDGQKALLGAESLVSRASYRAARHSPDDAVRGNSHMAGSSQAAGHGDISHGGWEQPALNSQWSIQSHESDHWYSADAADLEAGQFSQQAYPLGQLTAPALPHKPMHRTTLVQGPDAAGPLPQAQRGQLPASGLIGGQFWERLDAQSLQQQQQLNYPSFQPGTIDPMYASHAQEQGRFLDWASDVRASHTHDEDQGLWGYPDSSAAAGLAVPIVWPIPSSFRNPSQQLPQQLPQHVPHQSQLQQQQQQIVWPSARDFDAADFHAAAADAAVNAAPAVDDDHDEQQTLSPSSSRSTESDAIESDNGDDEYNEQIMFKGQSEVPLRAVAADWPDQMPQMQTMSREADDEAGHDRDLLQRVQLNVAKKRFV